MSTAAVSTMPPAAAERAPMSPIFRKVETEAEAPLFRNKQVDLKKKKKKRFSLRKMMSKIKSSKRMLNKSSSSDSVDQQEPTKLVLETTSATGAPRIEMVATDDEISSASSHCSEGAVAQSTTDSASPEASSISDTVEEEASIKEEPVPEVVNDGTSPVKTINYDLDDEEYIEEKPVEKTPITSSDAMALLLAGALMAAQAFA